MEQLGKDIVFDHTLSNPTGYACFTCHPETGRVAAQLGGQCVLRHPVGGRPRPGHPPQAHDVRHDRVPPRPIGPYFDADLGVYLGGTFWDGRTPDEPHQATQPFIDANEMANLISSNGIRIRKPGVFGGSVVKKVQSRPYTHLFKKVYGPDVFTKYTTPQIYTIITGSRCFHSVLPRLFTNG